MTKICTENVLPKINTLCNLRLWFISGWKITYQSKKQIYVRNKLLHKIQNSLKTKSKQINHSDKFKTQVFEFYYQ